MGDAMTRLLLISLGKLTGALLEAAARDPRFDSIVVAGRQAAHGQAKVNQARIGAALEGRFPAIEFQRFDFNEPGAAALLRRFAPDVAFAAPSLLPWWKVAASGNPRVKGMPFAAWLACHLAPMLKLRAVWAESGLACPWVGAAYPDVVNAVLAMTGPAPTVGCGNIAEAIPKIRFAVAEATGAPPQEVEVRLVAGHALEFRNYARPEGGELPPYLLEARWGSRDVSAEARAGLTRRMPIPYDVDFNLLTASATLGLLAALGGAGEIRTHAPSPNGLLGGYPIRVGPGKVALDLAPAWTPEAALAVNLRSLPFDGIAEIGADGVVHFAEPCAQALRALLGRPVERLKPEEAPTHAAELLLALS
jgi:hypothetical protein